MFNPIEFKHDVTSRPLKWMFEQEPDGSKWTDEMALTAIMVGFYTAALNLYPAAALIQYGVRGELLYQGISMGKKPWDLTFHYMAEASKATKLGARVGGKVGARIGGRLIPGVGWALLAYDVYDIAFNRSLWGFDLD